MTRLLISAAIFALATVSSVQAAPKQVVVAVSDLDLNAAAGKAALAARIHDAAVKVCGPVQYSADNRGSAMAEARSDNRMCIARLSEKAMANVDAARQVASKADANKVAAK